MFSSGSDAASIQTRATLSEDGKHFLLNGSKVPTHRLGTGKGFVTSLGSVLVFAPVWNWEVSKLEEKDPVKKITLAGLGTKGTENYC